MLFDTHAHLLDSKFDADRQEIIDNYSADNLIRSIEVGTNIKDSTDAYNLATQNEKIYAACGIHPHDAKEVSDNYIFKLADLLQKPKVVALGEIGLDFHYDFSPRDVQQKVFEQQLALALDLDMPIIIHSREATKPMMDTLKRFKGVSGVMHCFSGSCETAKLCVDLGLYVSFTGTITFKNAHKVRESFDCIPLDRVMAETDCPYMSPEPLRGKRNQPKNVEYVLRKMAEIKKLDFEKMCEINIQNAKELFKINI